MVARKKVNNVPERLIELLESAVAGSSQSAVSRESGVPLFTIQRCLKGIGEPTTATLEKLAIYFGKSVAWLRSEDGLGVGMAALLPSYPEIYDSPSFKSIAMMLATMSEEEQERAVETLRGEIENIRALKDLGVTQGTPRPGRYTPFRDPDATKRGGS